MPFAPRIAFVDVETTGASPQHARITEVGVVLVESTPDGIVVEEWSSLVNPGVPIPPEIQFLTGITPAMVAKAPRFEAIMPELAQRLHESVFVAHHARFDYGFIKQEFARCGVSFTARTLCTVRLSRLLYPDRGPHSLDALILRHDLPVTGRHRALGDARVLWAFIQKMRLAWSEEMLTKAVRFLLRQPSLPSHLPPQALSEIPDAPGAYAFLGMNDHALYIGKSTHLRERVASHFVNDYRSERGLRLASETRQIVWQETAGDLGARLLEQAWIRERLPAHNIALRRKQNQFFLAPDTGSPAIRLVRADTLEPGELAGYIGPFGSRAAARHLLIEAASAPGWCLRAMKIERGARGGPCFNRQLGRCAGCCVGLEPEADLARRIHAALATHAVPAWPFAGAIALIENNPARFREDWLVFDQWCFLGSVGNEDAARQLTESAVRVFDADAYRLLRKALGQPTYRIWQAMACSTSPLRV